MIYMCVCVYGCIIKLQKLLPVPLKKGKNNIIRSFGCSDKNIQVYDAETGWHNMFLCSQEILEIKTHRGSIQLKLIACETFCELRASVASHATNDC